MKWLLTGVGALAPGTVSSPCPAEPILKPAQDPQVGDGSVAPTEPPAVAFPRFRWGISALGGPMFGASQGGVGGFDARFGAQLSDLIGVYGQPIFLVGAGDDPDRSNSSAFGVSGFAALADFTFGDVFYAALGPELLYGGFGTASALTGTQNFAGIFFSAAARAGVVLGKMRPERRRAFHLGLDAHVIIGSNGAVVLPTVALGYEYF